ncbi:MAG: LLM class flavin-dependent oxidoreductase [bacterium]|nr:LLM class flavin-dependent oxidoreductase [Deltaproteobacteria bacterium]MCP4908744.1 LLM class flavin-dependent oxidoreductase [bacterium]
MSERYFGLFDHTETRPGQDPAAWYEGRLAIIEAAEQGGFEGVFLAEHHSTPLGMAPSPALLLAAAAARTHRIRLGALVFCLPMYNPLRLVEEVCMLDHMSNGRLDLGVGRGISPFELSYHGVPISESRARFNETLEILELALRNERLDYDGRFHRYADVPIELRSVQKPNPPFWFGMTTPENAVWAGRRGMNVASFSPNAPAGELATIYRESRREHRGSIEDLNPNIEIPRIGAVRHIYVAETDDQALAEATPAYAAFYANITKLWLKFNTVPAFYTPDLDVARGMDVAIVGSPETVREEVERFFDESGANYLIGGFSFGNLTQQQARRSIDLFMKEVTPAFTKR